MIRNKFTFKGRYQVYFKDTDTGGVMYHSRYVEFMEMARTDFFHSYGYFIRYFLEKRNIVFPVTELYVRYFKPAFLDNILEVELQVVKIQGAKILFSYQIHNQNRELLVTATTTNAVVNIRKLKPLRASQIVPKLVQDFGSEKS